MLAAAQTKIAQQEKELSEKDLKLQAQTLTIRETEKELEKVNLENDRLREQLSIHLRARFCARSEKYNEDQLNLFNYEDENLIPEESEIEESVKGEGPFKEVLVREYKRRKCGRKKLSDELPRKEIIIDIPEEEKICACGARLVKVGEDRSERLQVIPAQIYVDVTVRPKYACKNCEGSGDEDKPVFRQMPAPKNIIQKSIATSGPSCQSVGFCSRICNRYGFLRESLFQPQSYGQPQFP